MVERLEKEGMGLNLTWEVRDGILNHQTSLTPATLEGKIVRLSDKIAYINSDIDDSIRAGLIKEEEIPYWLTDVLGHSTNYRLNTLVHDIVRNSEGKNDISMSPEVEKAMFSLRSYMFEKVYYIHHTEELPSEFSALILLGETPERAVCDFIACMSDRYMVNLYKELMIPKAWSVLGTEHR